MILTLVRKHILIDRIPYFRHPQLILIWVNIGTDNVLSPGRHQAIVWTNIRVLLIGPSGKKSQWNFTRNCCFISFKKCFWKFYERNGNGLVKFDNSQNVLLNLSSHWHQTCHNSCRRCLSYNNKPWFRYMDAVWSPEHDTKYHWIVFQDKYLICIQPSYWVSFGRPHVVLQFIRLCLFQFNSQTQRLLSWPTFSYIRS